MHFSRCGIRIDQAKALSRAWALSGASSDGAPLAAAPLDPLHLHQDRYVELDKRLMAHEQGGLLARQPASPARVSLPNGETKETHRGLGR